MLSGILPEVEVSVIVPTYNERDNIARLIPLVHETLTCSGIKYELVVVDDNSPDGTAEVARELSKKYPVSVLVRPKKLGLASAIIDGLRIARGDIIVVMDADLQHPPETIPRLVEKIREGFDIVIASRYVEGGRVEAWSYIRKAISRGAIVLAHILLPRTRQIRDPISGFFAFRRSVVEGVNLSPVGYKILLEILVKGKWSRVAEIPYTFHPRTIGRSKLNSKEIFNYIAHLLRLISYQLSCPRQP